MARQSTWSEGEDEILLATPRWSAEGTNVRLAAAGFKPRSPQQIKDRRTYLTKKRRESPDHGMKNLMIATYLRVEQLKVELERVTEELEAAEQLLDQLVPEEAEKRRQRQPSG